jgi:alkylation response protein AidB-like acyl-CoA dehydrogenase
MTIPEEYGGVGIGSLGTTVVLMEVNRACASTGVTLSVHNSLVCDPIVRRGTEAQKRKYLPRLASGEWLASYSLSEAGSGSDAGSLRCRATESDGAYVLEGTKLWVSHGDQADLTMLFARTNPEAASRGITAFLVETAWPGYRAGKKERKMGIRGSSTVELQISGLRVPAENLIGGKNDGFSLAMEILDGGRIGIAAQGVGIAQACLDASVKYAKERRQFGQAIGEFGAIQEKIAEMAVRVESARLLTLRAAWLRDKGRVHTRDSSLAKLEASRAANFCAKEAVQIHGGAGYTQEFPVERYFRDARVTEIYEGTTEIQKIVIARSLLRG